MEKYFKVRKENHIYNDYFKWWNNLDNVKRKWEQFRKLEGIEATQFVPKQELYIVPTQVDLINFGRFLCKDIFPDGLKKFKKTSSVQKDWERFCKNNLELIDKPILFYDFPVMGKTRTRLFHYKDEVYCSVDNENLNDSSEIPEGYEEIKASEFYKIVEKIEEEE